MFAFKNTQNLSYGGNGKIFVENSFDNDYQVPQTCMLFQCVRWAKCSLNLIRDLVTEILEICTASTFRGK